MDFYEVLKKRRSIRSYKSDPIPKKSLDNIAEAIQCAPSACNLQPWSFRIVIKQELKNKIYECYKKEWLKEAPAIVIALANTDECWKRLDGSSIADMDMGIAMEHLLLAAAAEGLGTCWICAYEVEKMNKKLNILPPWTALAISPLGYPDEDPGKIKRKTISKIFKILD
jgi:nitroreductase